jgi:signal transduction histidine kinase/ligand-binding sensor domain-containing protein
LAREAQGDHLVHTWQTDDGLAQNWASSLAQTPDGYLWVGTRYGGLSRFDGVRFVGFNPQTSPGLQDVQVERLSVDKLGRLWVFSGNESISVLNHGEFTLVRTPRMEPRIRGETILVAKPGEVILGVEFDRLAVLDLDRGTNGWSILNLNPAVRVPAVGTAFHPDNEGTIWYITQRGGLARFRDGHAERCPANLGLVETNISALGTDSDGRLWVATAQHLAVWEGGRFADRTPTNGMAPRDVLQLAPCTAGGVWVMEPNRLRRCLNRAWVAEVDPESFDPGLSFRSYQLYADEQGGVWAICYGKGLWHVKPDGRVYPLTEREGMPSSSITSWVQDREGNVWIGTTGAGIARIRERPFHALTQANGLPGRSPSSVCIDSDGGLWAGTMDGHLARWSDRGFAVQNLPPYNAAAPESITVFPDRMGAVWVGSVRYGLMRFEGEQITRMPYSREFDSTIRVLFQDSRRRLWVSPLVGLCCVEDGRVRRLGAAEGFVSAIAVGAIAEDRLGALWIGTGPGDLWRYQDGHFTRFAPPADWPAARVAAVLADQEGTVWVGTLGNGLLRFKEGHFFRYQTPQGLPNNNVTQLMDDAHGCLWGGTYAGVFQAPKASLEAVAWGRAPEVSCRVFRRFDGLPSLECPGGFQPCCWPGPDGRLWFTTANGLTCVNPAEVSPNPNPPQVVIEEMYVDGKARNWRGARGGNIARGADGVLQIEPGRHYVQFRFTGLSFSAPDAIRFRVRLEGVEQDWEERVTQRLVGYGPLPPGDYCLRIRACNNTGVWNEKGASLAFRVLPFYWETWWFKIAASFTALALLGVTVGLVQRHRYHLRLERLDRQRQMERERARIARDLHDDLGTSLTQINLLSALAQQSPPGGEESLQILQQVRGRAREMVGALDEIVWAVNPKKDSLSELVDYFGNFAAEFFQGAPMRCRLDLPDNVPAQTLTAEVRHELFLAFKEALNNAARHSGGKFVWVRVKCHDETLEIRVEDDGTGLPGEMPARARGGNGLQNMRQRLENLGGKAEFDSQPGKGLAVIFTLPMSSRG